ncbi:MAG: hypothetical protein JWQ86_4637 [Mycobacterium sp.]|nr:hypothetical protein [Mycobacterium sp.]
MCYSSHDMALSLSPLFRFCAIASPGAYNSPTQFIDQVGTSYPFAKAAILNIDSSAVVKNGDPPSGAHSDIFGAAVPLTRATVDTAGGAASVVVTVNPVRTPKDRGGPYFSTITTA